MAEITVLSESVVTVPATIDDGSVVIAPEHLIDAVGYERKPEGLCREDVCVLVSADSGVDVDGGIDLIAAAAALGRRSRVNAEAGVVAVALPADQRRQALRDRVAPNFALPDLQGELHSLEQWRGKKKLLVAFASW